MGHAALQNLKINDRSFWLPAHLVGEIASKHDTNNNNSSSNIGGWSYVPGPKASAPHPVYPHSILIHREVVSPFLGEETKEGKVTKGPGDLQFVSGEARTEPCILFVCRGPGREPVRKGDQACLITESEFLSLCQAASLIRRRISLIMEFPIIEKNL